MGNAADILKGLLQGFVDVQRKQQGMPTQQEHDQGLQDRALALTKAGLGNEQLQATTEHLRAQTEELPGTADLNRRNIESEIKYRERPQRITSNLKPLLSGDGEIVGFYNDETGEIKTGVPPGLRTKAKPEPKMGPTGRLAPMVDASGHLTGTFNNVSGEYTPRPDFPADARKSPVPPAEMAQRGSLESIISDSAELGRLSEGEAGDKIGPVTGRWTAATRGILPQTQDVQDMFHISQNLGDQLLRARSGAQINEQEYKRLRTLVPDPRDERTKFDADLRRFQIEVKNTLSARKGGPVTQEADHSPTGLSAPGPPGGNPKPRRVKYDNQGNVIQ